MLRDPKALRACCEKHVCSYRNPVLLLYQFCGLGFRAQPLTDLRIRPNKVYVAISGNHWLETCEHVIPGNTPSAALFCELFFLINKGTCICVCISICMYECVYAHVYICIYLYGYTCIYIYIFVIYVYMLIYIYILFAYATYIHIHAEHTKMCVYIYIYIHTVFRVKGSLRQRTNPSPSSKVFIWRT